MRKLLISALVASSMAATAPQASADGFGTREDIVRGVAGLAVLGILLDRMGKNDDDRNPAYTYYRDRHGHHGHVVNERLQPEFRYVPVPRVDRDLHRHDVHKPTRKVIVKRPVKKVIVKKPVKKVIVKKPVKKVVVKKPVKKKIIVQKHHGAKHKHGHGHHSYWHRHPYRGHGHSHR